MIRLASLQDNQVIGYLGQISLGYQFDQASFNQQLSQLSQDPDHFIYVYQDESGLVQAFIHLANYQTLFDPPGLEVVNLAVNPAQQGQGLGQALLDFAEKLARDHQLPWIKISSSLKRSQAHKFYQKAGYKCLKEQKYFTKNLK